MSILLAARASASTPDRESKDAESAASTGRLCHFGVQSVCKSIVDFDLVAETSGDDELGWPYQLLDGGWCIAAELVLGDVDVPERR